MKLLRYIILRIILIGVQVFAISAIFYAGLALAHYDPAVGHSGLNGEQAIAAERQILGTSYNYTDQFWNFWGNRTLGDCEDFGEVLSNIGTGECNQNSGIGWEQPYYARNFDDAMMEKAVNTFLLFSVSFILYTIVATSLGIIAAIYEKSILDLFLKVFTSVGTAVPAILVINLFIRFLSDERTTFIDVDVTKKIAGLNPKLYVDALFSNLGFATYESSFSISDFYRDAWFLLFPVVAMVIVSLSFLFRIVRGLMINELKQPYIRTARAKGLKQRTIIFKHALPNIYPQVINAVAITVPIGITNIAIVEFMFKYNGLANMLIQSSNPFNFPVIHAGAILLVIFSSSLMTLSDIMVSLVEKKKE